MWQRPYLGIFEGGNGEKQQRKMDVRLGRWNWKNCLGVYWKMTANQYWQNLEKFLIAAKEKRYDA